MGDLRREAEGVHDVVAGGPGDDEEAADHASCEGHAAPARAIRERGNLGKRRRMRDRT